jgi:hypothetical protein
VRGIVRASWVLRSAHGQFQFPHTDRLVCLSHIHLFGSTELITPQSYVSGAPPQVYVPDSVFLASFVLVKECRSIFLDRGNFQVMRDYRIVNGVRRGEGIVNTRLRPMDEDSDMTRILL